MAASFVLSTIEKTRIRENLLAFISPESRSGVVSGNSVAIAGDQCVLIVDAGHFPPVTKSIITQIRETISRPVRFLVNTHWHNDHWRGNYLYKDEFPDLTILSHRFTRDQIQGLTYFHPQEILKRLPKGIKDRNERLNAGKRADGSPMGEEEKQILKDELEDVQNYFPYLSKMRVEAPNATFEGEIEIDLGSRTVKIFHLGRANTAGDVMVFVPDSRVIITGDVVVSPTPYAYGSYLREWLEVLKKIKRLEAVTIIPGHGPVQEGWQYVDTLMSLLRSVLDQVGTAVNDGLTLEETRKRVNLDTYESRLAGTSKYRKRAFREYFLEPAVERAYLEVKFSSEM